MGPGDKTDALVSHSCYYLFIYVCSPSLAYFSIACRTAISLVRLCISKGSGCPFFFFFPPSPPLLEIFSFRKLTTVRCSHWGILYCFPMLTRWPVRKGDPQGLPLKTPHPQPSESVSYGLCRTGLNFSSTVRSSFLVEAFLFQMQTCVCFSRCADQAGGRLVMSLAIFAAQSSLVTPQNA